MAFNLGDIYITLLAKTDQLKAGLVAVQDFGNQVESKMSGMAKVVDASQAAVAVLAKGMAIAETAAIALGGAGVKSAADFEQSRVAFDTMLGSAQAGAKMMADIAQFAKTTPFEVPGVVTAAKQLIAFGVAQDDVIPSLRRLGDIAAGVGVLVGQLSYVYGQVRLSGKLMAQDLMQFTNAGVPLLDYLSQTMHKTSAQIKADMDKGAGPSFEQVQVAINAMTDAGGRFGGMMDKQSHTFNGVVSNIKDGFAQMLRSAVGMDAAGNIIQGGLFDRVKNAAEAALPVMQKTFDTIGQILTWLDQHKGVMAAIAGGIMGAIVPAFVAWAAAAIPAAIATIAALAPFIAIGAAVAGVAYLIVSNWQNITDAFSVMWDFIVGGWNNILAVAMAVWQGIWDAVKPIIDFLVAALEAYFTVYIYIFDVIRGIAIVAWQAIWSAIAPVINAIGSALNWVGGVAAGVWNSIAGGFSWAWNQIKGVWSAAVGFFGGIWSAIAGAANSVASTIANAVGGAFNAVTGAVKSAINWMIDRVNGVIRSVNNSAGKLPGVPDIGQIPRLFKGFHNFLGGRVLLGDSGPEIVDLPQGSSVYNGNETRQMLANSGGGGGPEIHIHLDGANITSPQVADQYAERIGDGIMRQLARQVRLST